MGARVRPEFECGVTASFLRSGQAIGGFSNAAAIVAGVGLFLSHGTAERMALAASLLCWPVACYLGLRVRIDEGLFRDLAVEPERRAGELDELLRGWGMARATRERSISDRSRGALRLWRQMVAAAAVQWIALAAGAALHFGAA